MPRSTAFADDVRRVPAPRADRARPDTLAYRAARFVRRHAGGVAARRRWSLLVAGLTGVYTRTSRRAARSRAARGGESHQGQRADDGPADQRRSRTSIRGASGQPTTSAPSSMPARAQVQKELAGEPELQAEMLTTMGRTYRRLAAFDKAQQLLEQALASGRAGLRRRARAGGADARLPGRRARGQRRLPAAGQRLEEALAMRRKLLGPQHRGRRRHARGARTGLSGPGTESAGRAAASRGAGHPPEGARRRSPRDCRQRERPRLGAAPQRRSRRRRDAAPPVARHQRQDARRRSPEHRVDAARSRAHHRDARRLPSPPNRCCARRSRMQRTGARRPPPCRRGDAQQPVARPARGAPLRRGRRAPRARPATIAAAALGAEHQLVAIYTVNLGGGARRRRQPPQPPSRCCAKACASAPAHRASCRRGAAPGRRRLERRRARSLLGAGADEAPALPRGRDDAARRAARARVAAGDGRRRDEDRVRAPRRSLLRLGSARSAPHPSARCSSSSALALHSQLPVRPFHPVAPILQVVGEIAALGQEVGCRPFFLAAFRFSYQERTHNEGERHHVSEVHCLCSRRRRRPGGAMQAGSESSPPAVPGNLEVHRTTSRF